MAHELEIRDGKAQMFYVGETPWHRLGTPVPDALCAADAIVQAGQAWEAHKHTLYLGDATPIQDAVAVVRDLDQRVLGVVGPEYEILQNKEAFAWADTMLGAGVKFVAAGCLYGGRRTWILAKMPHTIETVPGDPTTIYLLIVNSFDGSWSLGGYITPIRAICLNTVMAAIREAVRSFTVKHTRNIRAGMAEGARALRLVQQYQGLFAEEMKTLAARAADWKLTETFIDRMLPLPEKAGRGHTIAERSRESLLDCIDGGRGTEIPGVRGTFYGLYQGAVEYADYRMAGRGDDQAREENRLVSTTVGGPRLVFKDKALSILRSMA